MPEGPKSLASLFRMFAREQSCLDFLEQTRWPDRFQCRFCLWKGEPYRFAHRAKILRCRS